MKKSSVKVKKEINKSNNNPIYTLFIRTIENRSLKALFNLLFKFFS